MAHFALLDENNIVQNIVVINNDEILDENGQESEEIGIAICKRLVNDENSKWKQTSYNGNIRKRYAGIGMEYNEEIDMFIIQQPYDSWVLDKENGEWESPIPYPELSEDMQKTHTYIWDEENLTWVLKQNSELLM